MSDAAADERSGRRRRSRRTALVWLLLSVLLGGVFIGPWLLMGAAMWAADGPWDFQRQGLTHWLLVRGSHLDRLGFVDAQHGSERFSVRLQEGTFPGWRIATYTSHATPRRIGDAYADRCRSMKLKITQQTGDDGRMVLVCEIEPYIDAEVLAKRIAGSDATHVTLKVWGSD